MENQTAVWIIALIAVACLAAVIGYIAHPEAPECEVCKVCKVCSECEECPEIELVECEAVEECEATNLDLKAQALEDFLDELDDNEDWQECEEEVYDFDQIEVKKEYDKFLTEIVDEEEYSVTFELKIKFKDKDVSEKCYQKVEVVASYEEGEDPVIERTVL